MRSSALAVALCLCAVTLPACHKKNTTHRTLGTNQPRPTAPGGAPLEPGEIGQISVALHSGPEGKEASDTVIVRVLRGSDVIGQRSTGTGEMWVPGAVKAFEVPLSAPIEIASARDLRIEVSKTDTSGRPGPAWTVQAEALGEVTDGRVVRLLELTPGAPIGGGTMQQSWTMSPE